MNIHETITAVQQALDGADRLARLCEDAKALEHDALRILVARTANQVAIDVARAKAGLAGRRG